MPRSTGRRRWRISPRDCWSNPPPRDCPPHRRRRRRDRPFSPRWCRGVPVVEIGLAENEGRRRAELGQRCRIGIHQDPVVRVNPPPRAGPIRRHGCRRELSFALERPVGDGGVVGLGRSPPRHSLHWPGPHCWRNAGCDFARITKQRLCQRPDPLPLPLELPATPEKQRGERPR
jgi:hypothetical protein